MAARQHAGRAAPDRQSLFAGALPPLPTNRNRSIRNLQLAASIDRGKSSESTRLVARSLSAGRTGANMRKPAVPRRPNGVELEAQMRRLVGLLAAAAGIASVVVGGTAATASTT